MELLEIVPNVLTHEECDLLIKEVDFLHTDNNVPAYGDINDLQRRNATEHYISKKICEDYKFEVKNVPLLWYKPGITNSPHADSFNIKDGIVVRTAEWLRSAIIFLNDDFDGGELVFPNQGVSIKPVKGNMVVASCGIDYIHYTTAASSDRYTLVFRINN